MCNYMFDIFLNFSVLVLLFDVLSVYTYGRQAELQISKEFEGNTFNCVM